MPMSLFDVKPDKGTLTDIKMFVRFINKTQSQRRRGEIDIFQVEATFRLAEKVRVVESEMKRDDSN